MAKITIAGNAVVVTSALKLEDIKTIAKYQPKALTLMGGEDGKEPIFAIGTTAPGKGSISSVGASFDREANDGSKLATITVVDTVPDTNVKDWAADKLGAAIMALNALEAKLPEVLSTIAANKAAVMENISVAG